MLLSIKQFKVNAILNAFEKWCIIFVVQNSFVFFFSSCTKYNFIENGVKSLFHLSPIPSTLKTLQSLSSTIQSFSD